MARRGFGTTRVRSSGPRGRFVSGPLRTMTPNVYQPKIAQFEAGHFYIGGEEVTDLTTILSGDAMNWSAFDPLTDIVEGEGFTGDPLLIGPLYDAIIGGCTMVVEFEKTLIQNAFQFYIFDILEQDRGAVLTSSSGANYFTFRLEAFTASESPDGAEADCTAVGIHKIAITMAAEHLAISVDGGPAATAIPPAGWNTPQLGDIAFAVNDGTTIRWFDVYAPRDDADLSELSAL